MKITWWINHPPHEYKEWCKFFADLPIGSIWHFSLTKLDDTYIKEKNNVWAWNKSSSINYYAGTDHDLASYYANSDLSEQETVELIKAVEVPLVMSYTDKSGAWHSKEELIDLLNNKILAKKAAEINAEALGALTPSTIKFLKQETTQKETSGITVDFFVNMHPNSSTILTLAIFSYVPEEIAIALDGKTISLSKKKGSCLFPLGQLADHNPHMSSFSSQE